MHLAANSNPLITFSLMGKYILTRLYPAKNILALPQTHKSQLWCLKFFAEFLVQNNYSNILYINTSSVRKILPVSISHHAEFCLSIWKERINLATNCARNQTQHPQFAQGDLNSLWKAPWSQQCCTSCRNHLVATFTIEISVWIILYTKYTGLKF